MHAVRHHGLPCADFAAVGGAHANNAAAFAHKFFDVKIRNEARAAFQHAIE
jgi:hypothetical protein